MMMRTFAIISIFFTAMLLSSCGLHEFKAGDPLLALEHEKEASKTACYQSLARNGVDYSKMSDMAVVVLEQQRAMVQMFGAATGKNMDPCSGGTNLNDVLIADSTNRNATAQKAIGVGGSVATTGIVTTGVVAGVNSIGRNSGVRTYGDSSPATKTSADTTTTTRAVNAGDGSASTSPADPVITPAAEPVAITP